MSLQDRYFRHYLPLVQEFVDNVESLGLDIQAKVAQPFLPLFGEAYERSSLRMAIVGQDTKYWGCLKAFLGEAKLQPTKVLQGCLDEFQGLDFVDWGGSRYTFWGFAMMFLAALHGRTDWGIMKHRGYPEILSSFAWGNGNAVEYHASSPKHMPWDQWELVRKAGEHLNGIHHLISTIQPRVVVVLWKDMSPETYFAGHPYTLVEDQAGVRHYRLDDDVDVFHMPHPGRMRWEGTPADHYCAGLIAKLQNKRLAVAFPDFVQAHGESDTVVHHLKNTAPLRSPEFTKFKFVEWVAEELKKRGSFMSVPTLATLLNSLGYRTDCGYEFEGVRGTYNLVSGAYHRLVHAGKSDRARMVAEAFRKPNFEYAYEE